MKDYYSILGVLPSADEAVIKAVYKVLALKYHPDRNTVDRVSTDALMLEINEAYGVLSNPEKRTAYDRSRLGSSEQEDFSETEDSRYSSSDGSSEIEESWNLAREYYPDLDKRVAQLAKISPSLIYPYKLLLLDKKEFENRYQLATKMTDMYLEAYFGKNFYVKEFAKELLLKGNRNAARALNKSVKLFGSSIDPQTVINKIVCDFNIDRAQSVEKVPPVSIEDIILVSFLILGLFVIGISLASNA